MIFSFKTFIIYILFFALGFLLCYLNEINGFQIFCITMLSMIVALLKTNGSDIK